MRWRSLATPFVSPADFPYAAVGARHGGSKAACPLCGSRFTGPEHAGEIVVLAAQRLDTAADPVHHDTAMNDGHGIRRKLRRLRWGLIARINLGVTGLPIGEE